MNVSSSQVARTSNFFESERVLESASISQAAAKASLLLVDAPVDARRLTAERLRQMGYRVDEAGSGDEVLARLESQSYDLAILDVALPKTDGVELMRHLRHTRPDLMIVVLTAHATVDSAVAAVKLNAVDYILKPCKVEDLVLTISRALEERAQQVRHQRLLALVGEAMNALRQPEPIAAPLPSTSTAPAISPDTLRVGALALDRQKRQVTLSTNPPRTVDLTEGELSILVVLMEKPNQVLSYNDLAKSALGYEGRDKWTGESVIRSTVFRLRHKIEPGPDAPCLIRTVRGRGYFFSPA